MTYGASKAAHFGACFKSWGQWSYGLRINVYFYYIIHLWWPRLYMYVYTCLLFLFEPFMSIWKLFMPFNAMVLLASSLNCTQLLWNHLFIFSIFLQAEVIQQAYYMFIKLPWLHISTTQYRNTIGFAILTLLLSIVCNLYYQKYITTLHLGYSKGGISQGI